MQQRERDKPIKFYVRNHVEVGEEEGEGGGEKKLLSCIPSKPGTLANGCFGGACVPDFVRITCLPTTPFVAAWRLNHLFTKFLTYNFKDFS